MSVTVTIANNRQHAAENNAMQYDVYDCQRCEDGITPGCHECGGTDGKVRFEILPFELNVSNDNFGTLWSSLGLDRDFCGSIDPRALLKALRHTDPALAVKESQNKPRLIQFGVDIERVEYYHSKLRDIGEEAERREEQILWG